MYQKVSIEHPLIITLLRIEYHLYEITWLFPDRSSKGPYPHLVDAAFMGYPVTRLAAAKALLSACGGGYQRGVPMKKPLFWGGRWGFVLGAV